MSLIQDLQELGFSEESARIYCSLLESGDLHVSDISKRAKINRTTLYPHLDGLLRDGFVVRIKKGRRFFYRVHSPERLLKDQENKTRKVSKMLPELLDSYQKHTHKPDVRVYQGKDEIKKLYLEVCDSIHPIQSIVSLDRFLSLFRKRDLVQFTELIRLNDNKVFNLAEDGPLARKYKQEKLFVGVEEIRFLPKHFSFKLDVVIFGLSKIAFISFPTQTATVIHDANIVDFHKLIFDEFWKQKNL